MRYPKLLNLDSETLEKLRSYIIWELTNHNGERGPYLDELMVYQELYWAKPVPGDGEGPIKGGSNLIIPLIAISVEAQHARNMTTLFALDDFTQISLPDVWADIDKGLEKLLDHEMLKVAGLYNFMDNTLLEGTKYGTGIGKAGYERIVRTGVTEVNGERIYTDIVTKQGLVFDSVSCANFVMPYAYQDPQTAPWCGEEHERSLYEIKQMEDSGMFYPGTYEKLLNYYTPISPQTPGQEFKQNQSMLENKQPVLPKTIRFYELYITFDPDMSGRQRELVVYFHWYAQLCMGIRDNWFEDLRRPYRHYNHFKIEHRWTGMGKCKQLDQFQLEITTQHRLRIDNSTMANLRMFKVKKMSGLSPNEALFPGKIWYVDEMDDVDSFQMGEIYNSAYNNEQSAVLYSQMRSGDNELTLGMPQAGTPGTASSDLARVQESSRRFDYTYKAIRNFAAELTLDSLSIVKQFGPRNISIYKNIPNGLKVQEFITTVPMMDIRDQVVVDIGIAGQNKNKLLDRSSWTQLSGILTQYYTNLIQLANQTGNQQLVQLINTKALSAGSEGMKQILESFDVRNVNKIIVTAEDLALVGVQLPPTITGADNGAGQSISGTPEAGGINGISGLVLPPGVGDAPPINFTPSGTGI